MHTVKSDPWRSFIARLISKREAVRSNPTFGKKSFCNFRFLRKVHIDQAITNKINRDIHIPKPCFSDRSVCICCLLNIKNR